jgi:DNA helicase II / ATP-dependent DNA helicase PcrA
MRESPEYAETPEPATNLLADLNERQRAAVLALDGPLLVLAGAGTGKTRVLTTRLAHILASGRAFPSEILAVTFTNKAANEMKERIARLIGRPVEGWWLGTFHALAVRILRRNAELVGLKSNFTIIDTDDQLRLMKQILAAEGLDTQRWPARLVLGIVERWKDRGLTPEKVSRAEMSELAGGRLRDIYEAYQQRLVTLNACDFGDLLLYNLVLFQKAPEELQRYQRQFKFILVDEYQDTNVAQYLWLRALAQGHKNICCVGDDDQSVYGWRGAEVENILKFEQDFPGATIVRLEQNYRSTPHILAAASGLIAHNRGRLGKTLWTEAPEGEMVRILGAWDGEEEASKIAEEIENQQRKGATLSDIAILVRAGFQTRAFEERFIAQGIPYRVIGGPRFYERLEIRDALAYLRLVNRPDDGLAFERVVNTPRRGLGDSTLRRLNEISRQKSIPLAQAAQQIVETDELKPASRRALGLFLGDLERWRAMAATMDHAELAGRVLDESGYTDMWRKDKSIEAPGRVENLQELIRAIEEFENLEEFLDHVALVMENAAAAPRDQVSLMTLHGAKGLEFPVVFLPGWEEGLFPHPRALDEQGLKGLEEERRLAYVGLTRAKRLAILCHAASRRIHNQWQNSLPSRFLAELPEAHVERLDRLDLPPLRDQAFAQMGAFAHRQHFRAGARPAPMIDLAAETLPGPGSAFPAGARIFHRKFGYGKVLHAEGDKLDIAFDKAGVKKVMASFIVAADKAG